MLDVGWVKSKKERKRNLRKYGGSLGSDLSKVVLSALECQQQEDTQQKVRHRRAASQAKHCARTAS